MCMNLTSVFGRLLHPGHTENHQQQLQSALKKTTINTIDRQIMMVMILYQLMIEKQQEHEM